MQCSRQGASRRHWNALQSCFRKLSIRSASAKPAELTSPSCRVDTVSQAMRASLQSSSFSLARTFTADHLSYRQYHLGRRSSRGDEAKQEAYGLRVAWHVKLRRCCSREDDNRCNSRFVSICASLAKKGSDSTSAIGSCLRREDERFHYRATLRLSRKHYTSLITLLTTPSTPFSLASFSCSAPTSLPQNRLFSFLDSLIFKR